MTGDTLIIVNEKDKESNKQRMKMKKRAQMVRNLTGYAFVAPNYILMLIFTAFPMVFSLVLAFTEWDLLSGFNNIKFVGLKNFARMPHDIYFTESILNNLLYTVMYIPLALILALLFAILLNEYVFGKNILRLFIFLPHITNVAAISILWMVLYSPSGPIVKLLESFGINSPIFLADQHWALPAIVVVSVWRSFGYNSLIFIAGLQAIPTELYEAAYIDGVTPWKKLTQITIPLLTPTIFFLLITSVIGSFQVFGTIQIMTQGGPVRSTMVLVYHIYRTAFQSYQFGYASAMALVLFVVILIVTLIQWRGQEKWVNY